MMTTSGAHVLLWIQSYPAHLQTTSKPGSVLGIDIVHFNAFRSGTEILDGWLPHVRHSRGWLYVTLYTISHDQSLGSYANRLTRTARSDGP